MLPLNVPEDLLSTRPPIIRPQIPPDVSSGFGFGSPATKALPCETNAVFIVPIPELIALEAPTTPPMIGVKAVATGFAPKPLVQPGCCGTLGACADAPVDPATINPIAEAAKKPSVKTDAL